LFSADASTEELTGVRVTRGGLRHWRTVDPSTPPH